MLPGYTLGMIFGKYSFLLLLPLGVLSGVAGTSSAQVVAAGRREPVTVSAGGFVSIFQPDYLPQKIAGAGAYVDANLFHGAGVEAEGRWLRWHDYAGIQQDNYLIGPRIKVKHFWRAQPYVKVLGGFTHMRFENGDATGRFTTFAGGGGVDLHLTHRWTVRPVDFEYQIWPTFLGGTLSPYGVSAGIGYRVF